MGEIADGIINGQFCPCGEHLGNGEGFPQHCSARCSRDFGGGNHFVEKPNYKGVKYYRGQMDEKFFNAMEVKVVKHQPWQFSLHHPGLPEGQRFVWYPGKGTLMLQTEHGNTKIGQFLDSEEVWEEITKKIIK